MPWEIWIIAGLLLFLSEMFVPLDFILVFIGLSCVFTGLVTATGILPARSWEWILATVLLVIGLFGLRPRIREYFATTAKPIPGALEQEEVILLETVQNGKEGRGQARGTTWIVRNLTGNDLSEGERCTVKRREGLTLILE